MRRVLLAVMVFLLARPLAESGTQPMTEDAKLAKHFIQYLDAEFKLHPLYATRSGNHDHDDKLDDLSAKARKASVERTRKTLADLPKTIDYKKLSRSGQIDFEIWQHELKKTLWLAENTDPFANDPRTY